MFGEGTLNSALPCSGRAAARRLWCGAAGRFGRGRAGRLARLARGSPARRSPASPQRQEGAEQLSAFLSARPLLLVAGALCHQVCDLLRRLFWHPATAQLSASRLQSSGEVLYGRVTCTRHGGIGPARSAGKMHRNIIFKRRDALEDPSPDLPQVASPGWSLQCAYLPDHNSKRVDIRLVCHLACRPG